ncbi:HAMP domain-containing protein [Cohnella sp. CFH 77786]|uniref:cache domain-containing sensor histidine kinase n=1 Tax=Cohnella sp. CFH 77786 TaxID=2662265 RepID=UPI001C60B36C|nr:sensor histidine kinase [Cohnella sp. CFH 77786]MBW5446484.1 HAMP domain-containing protein [Cohnella sp. CFH 77786]
MSKAPLVELGRFSIRHKVILLFFLVIMLPFLFIGYFSHSKSVEAIQNVSAAISSQMMEKNARNLDNYLELVSKTQNEIMYSADMQNLLSIIPSNTLEELEIASKLIQYSSSLSSNSHDYSIRIFPIDPSRYPTFTHSIYHNVDVEKEEWFTDAKSMKSPFWQLFLPEDNEVLYKEPILSLIKQLYGLEKTRPLGYVAADIKVSTLSDYLAPVKMLEQQQVMLIDDKDVIVYHQDQSLIGTSVASRKLRDYLRQTPAGADPIDIEGVEYMVTYAPLANNDWKVVSLLPVSVLTKPVAGIERVSVLFLLFYFGLSVITVAYLTSRFTNPIHRLVQAMRKVERGEFLFSVPRVSRRDEIGWLYLGFDNLVRRIDRLVQSAEKEAKDKKELEFQVLTHQINPHFLYNTLEAIRWKAESRRADDISEMVRSLGNLLRLSLNDGRELTRVEREIEHVRAYVGIQSARQDTSIRVVYMIDDDIMRLPCLRLLFQPLVENAIKHGTRHAGDGDAVKIVIKGSRKPDHLKFEIIDNGPGISEEIRSSLLSADQSDQSRRKGVGLRNVHERLVIYFGERYGLRILNREGEGTVIELTHPILCDEPAQAG